MLMGAGGNGYNPFQPLRQSITDAASIMATAAQGAGEDMAKVYESSSAAFEAAMKELSSMMQGISQQNIQVLTENSAKSQALLEPFRQAGMNSMAMLQSLLGVPVTYSAGQGGTGGTSYGASQGLAQANFTGATGERDPNSAFNNLPDKFTMDGRVYDKANTVGGFGGVNSIQDPNDPTKVIRNMKVLNPKMTRDKFWGNDAEYQVYSDKWDAEQKKYDDYIDSRRDSSGKFLTNEEFADAQIDYASRRYTGKLDAEGNAPVNSAGLYEDGSFYLNGKLYTPPDPDEKVNPDEKADRNYGEYLKGIEATNARLVSKGFNPINPQTEQQFMAEADRRDQSKVNRRSSWDQKQQEYDAALAQWQQVPASQKGTTLAQQQQATAANTGLPGQNQYNLYKVDPNEVINGPEAQAKLKLGTDAIERQLQASGQAGSGRALEQLFKYGRDLASTEIGAAQDRAERQISQIQNMLLGMTGIGQQSATTQAGIQTNLGNQIAQQNTNAGNAAFTAGMAGAQNTANSAIGAGESRANARLMAGQILSQAEAARGQLDFQAWQQGFGPKQGIQGIGGLLGQIAGPLALMGSEMGGLGGLGMLLGGAAASVGSQNFA